MDYKEEIDEMIRTENDLNEYDKKLQNGTLNEQEELNSVKNLGV